jgi:hypothetical protein
MANTPISILALVTVMLSADVARAADCNGRLIPISEFTPFEGVYYIKSTYGNYYQPNSDCVMVSSGQKSEFKKLVFHITNTLPTGPEVGFVAVQHVKSYSKATQDRKFKVSRSEGWFLTAENGKREKVSRIDDEPIAVAANNWNGTFAAARMPEQFNEMLGIEWTAWLLESGINQSASPEDFWRIPNDLDLRQKVVGNGIFRFLTNSDATPKLLPLFDVTVQSRVIAVELKMLSNIDELSDQQLEIRFQ